MSWPRFLGLLGVGMLGWNAVFASLFVACGPGALQVPDAVMVDHPWLVAFFLSVQTFATIGYGQIAPSGIAANLVVVIESFLSILFVTLVTGIVFARFSRPTARILFSEQAIVAPYRGGKAVMLRLVNVRRSQLFDISARLIMAYWETNDGKRQRRFTQLPLERDTVNFLPLSWTLVHPIDSASPLAGLDEPRFRSLGPEFLVLLAGVDETWEQTVHTRTSYAGTDVIWGARFADIFDRSQEHDLAIDVRRLSTIERVSLS
jgi:inward rectifier potassium channel